MMNVSKYTAFALHFLYTDNMKQKAAVSQVSSAHQPPFPEKEGI